MVKTIVFPSSFFDTRKVDEDLQAEYDAVLETGLFDVVLFGYDKWFGEGGADTCGQMDRRSRCGLSRVDDEA